MRINLKQNFLRVSFVCPVYVWNFRFLKRTVLRKMQTSIFFLLLVIVMDSIKSNVSVNFVEGIQ